MCACVWECCFLSCQFTLSLSLSLSPCIHLSYISLHPFCLYLNVILNVITCLIQTANVNIVTAFHFVFIHKKILNTSRFFHVNALVSSLNLLDPLLLKDTCEQKASLLLFWLHFICPRMILLSFLLLHIPYCVYHAPRPTPHPLSPLPNSIQNQPVTKMEPPPHTTTSTPASGLGNESFRVE